MFLVVIIYLYFVSYLIIITVHYCNKKDNNTTSYCNMVWKSVGILQDQYSIVHFYELVGVLRKWFKIMNKYKIVGLFCYTIGC